MFNISGRVSNSPFGLPGLSCFMRCAVRIRPLDMLTFVPSKLKQQGGVDSPNSKDRSVT